MSADAVGLGSIIDVQVHPSSNMSPVDGVIMPNVPRVLNFPERRRLQGFGRRVTDTLPVSRTGRSTGERHRISHSISLALDSCTELAPPWNVDREGVYHQQLLN
jgi:hypothetical protein